MTFESVELVWAVMYTLTEREAGVREPAQERGRLKQASMVCIFFFERHSAVSQTSIKLSNTTNIVVLQINWSLDLKCKTNVWVEDLPRSEGRLASTHRLAFNQTSYPVCLPQLLSSFTVKV